MRRRGAAAGDAAEGEVACKHNYKRICSLFKTKEMMLNGATNLRKHLQLNNIKTEHITPAVWEGVGSKPAFSCELEALIELIEAKLGCIDN